MSEDFGTGVSRTLSAIWRQFGPVVMQQFKPPLDSELNLAAQVDWERLAQTVRTVVPSGFFTDPTRALNDFQFNSLWSNLFIFGNPRKDNPSQSYDADEKNPVVWANVNGWIIPVAGTHIDTATGVENLVRLYPPPASDARVDFVFLEAWATLVAPNPSTANKPSAATIWKYGNVDFGGTNITDDIEDPDIRFETSERVQVQYRLRVYGSGVGLGAGVALDVYPDGLDDPNVLGQGTATSPVGGFTFTNMREELGDPSLWRAGNGDATNDLGTIDGYVYAVPVCAIFRRNSGTYMTVTSPGTANQNGAFLRTPSTQLLPDPLTGARVLLQATLGQALAHDDENLNVSITNLDGSGLEDPNLNLTSTFIVIGGEVIGIDSVNVPGGQVHIPLGGRGRNGTDATGHAVDTAVNFYSLRPDGMFADEVATTDILDLRRTINTTDWDYQRLLAHNVAALARGDLRTAWKQSGTGTTQGVTVHEVDYLQADGSVATPNGTEELDGPDGIRQVWSDAAVQQADITILLDDEATLVDNSIGFTSADQFDTTVTWQVGPDFYPIGYVNLGGVFTGQPWTNGTSLYFHIGGETGARGARGTFRDGSDREVRFVTPKEYFKTPATDPIKGNQYPITLRFLEERALETPPSVSPITTGAIENIKAYPGPMYPWNGRNFETPYIVLGQIVNSTLKVTVPVTGFAGPFGGAGLLTGTAEVTVGDDTVTGTGTLFTTEVAVGDLLRIGGAGQPLVRVRSITSDTSLTLCVKHPTGEPALSAITNLLYYTLDIGVNFDVAGVWYSEDTHSNIENDPTKVTQSLLNSRRTLYGMMTANGTDPSGFSSELYAVTRGDKDSIGNNGAWKIIGAGSAVPGQPNFNSGFTPNRPGTSRLALVPLSADFTGIDTATGNSIDLEVRSQEHLAELDGSYDDGTPDLCIVLTDIGGDLSGSPWDRDALGYQNTTTPNYDLSMPRDAGVNDKVAIQSKLLCSFSLLYHPGRGGMARVPDDVVKVALRDANASYLRRNKAVIDPTFPNIPGNETLYDTTHVQLWNRLPALGLNAPTAPNYGGNIVGFTEQDREHELFIDKGSKTLVFRPMRDRAMTLQSLTMEDVLFNSWSLLGASYAYPDAHPKDNLQLFTRTGGNPSTGKGMGFAVPREFMPRFGRQDIPYYVDTAAGAGTFLAGINHLFKDTTNLTSPVFHIIGGRDNTTGGNQVTPMFFRTSSPANYGHGMSGSNITPTVVTSFLEARKTTSINTANPFAQGIVDRLRAVNSSDLGKGLKGIQLPPYYGIARLYGVYDARDYETKGGRTFLSNRVTLDTDPAPNLLRTDATQQTLFILQDGAKDLTTTDGDHTYIIPSEVIDITKALGYLSTDSFENYDYIVECEIFGFAQGWINENNYVLVRCHGGTGKGALGGAANSDGDVIQLEGVPMVIPTAAAYNDALYVAHNRTVYQGDPYMTRSQSTRTLSDYEFRYGRPDEASLFELATPIQQFYASGAPVPTVPNARAFEVLAAMDFYTTLGTGNVAGNLYPGTFMDVGFMEPSASTRIPTSATAPPWRINTRAFTEGQKTNPSRAEATVVLTDNSLLNPVYDDRTHAIVQVTTPDGVKVPFAFYTAASLAWERANPPTFISQVPGGLVGPTDVFSIVMLDEETFATPTLTEISTNFGVGPTTVFSPGESNVIDATTLFGITADFGDTVLVYPKNQNESVFKNTNGKGALVFDGWVKDVAGSPKVTLRATSTVGWQSFETASGDFAVKTQTTLSAVIAPGASNSIPVTFTGAAIGDPVVWSWDGSTVTPAAALQVTVGVTAPNTVTILIANPSDNTVSATWPGGNFRIAVLREGQSSTYWDINLTAQSFYVKVLKPLGDVSKTSDNLVAAINKHPNLINQAIAYKLSAEESIVQSVAPGAEGHGILVETFDIYLNARGPQGLHVRGSLGTRNSNLVASYLQGGSDIAVNGGNGTTQLQITGMTERLPLGILLQDSDFLGENPLGDTATAMKTSPAGMRPLQTVLPLTTGGEEFTRFLGAPGDLVGMADGSVLQYAPFNEVTAPTGAKTLRIYRGGGSAFVLSGLNPGGPVDWVTDTFSAPLKPVLKGAALVCRALLVRNFYEEPFGTPFTVSEGDEIQMVVITHGVIGNGNTQDEGIELSGIISPSGYGEGYAASDRYRVEGRPMFKGFSRVTPNPATVTLAPLPDVQ